MYKYATVSLVEQQSPLHLAAEYGHFTVVETLTQLGANMEGVTLVSL